MEHSKQIKHSGLGVIAFSIFLSPLLPLIMVFVFKGEILHKIFKYEQLLAVSNFFTYWIISAPILGFILSTIDLNKPDRLRILPRIVVILSGLGFITMIILTFKDIKRIAG